MKKISIIIVSFGVIIISFFIGRFSVKRENVPPLMHKINENLIPYIKEYINVIGQKKENREKNFFTVSIRQKEKNYHLTFRYNNYVNGMYLTTVCDKDLILESNFMNYFIKPNREWVSNYLLRYYKKDYDTYIESDNNSFNPIVGDFDELEIVVDYYGNVISHRIHFTNTNEFQDYILKQDSLKSKLRNEPTDDL